MAAIRFPPSEDQYLETNSFAINNSSTPTPPTYECAFNWCELTYSTSFTKGKLQEDLVNSTSLTWDGSCPTADFTSYDLCTGYVKDSGSADTAIGRNYTVKIADSFNTGQFLQNNLIGVVNSTTFQAFQYPMTRALYSRNDGDIPKTVRGIAQSMTSYVRQGPNSTILQGHAMIAETYIHVQWAWLTLPLAIVVLGSVFLCVCIAVSSEQSNIVWKSSILAGLFHGLSGWEHDDLNALSLSEMEHTANAMLAKLEQDEDGHVMLLRH
jgi:hypothetical protein